MARLRFASVLLGAALAAATCGGGETPVGGEGGESGGGGGKSGEGGGRAGAPANGGTGGHATGGASPGTGGAAGPRDAATSASDTAALGTGGADTPGGAPEDAASGDATGAGPVTAHGAADTPNFFITSTGTGPQGGNLGGLAGADERCNRVAAAAGFANKKWAAYVSVNVGPGGGPVHAHDRIGNGPWYNTKGLLLAENLAKLHPMIDPLASQAGWLAYKAAIPAKPLFVDEKGAPVPHAEHGIWTGSDGMGKVIADKTCKDWTSLDMADRGQVGHADLPAVIVNPGHSPSWNSAHDAACAPNSSASGRVHCFAIE